MTKVLFVSHDADLCAAAARALARVGFEVTAATHGGHALLECLQTDFNVLVIEDRLPEGTGTRVAASLRRLAPGLRVIRLSDGPAATGDGAVVRRPFTADDLVAALAETSVPSAS
jgi:DNA-binding response OmpR family regulator